MSAAHLNNGVTGPEICEVLLQVAVYCGMPAGMSFRERASLRGSPTAARRRETAHDGEPGEDGRGMAGVEVGG